MRLACCPGFWHTSRIMDVSDALPTSREIKLHEIFPDLIPIRRVPFLFTLNGFGTSLAGRRDFDAPTGTFVTNLVVTLLWIPVFVLAAYRVIPASGNSYHFLGREPVSKWVRRLQWGVAACVVGGLIVVGPVSDGYRTHQQLKTAQAHLAAGEWSEAAKVALPLCDPASRGTKAFGILKEATDAGWGEGATADQSLGLARVIAEQSNSSYLFPELGERLQTVALRHAENNPQIALELIKLAILHPGNSPLPPFVQSRKEIARQWCQQAPDDVHAACAYAVELEEDDKTDELRKLLTPHQQNPALAGTEAARILGGILFDDRQYAPARQLLQSYATPRMLEFHAAEKDYASTMERRQQFYLNELEHRHGPPEFYPKYEAADEVGRNALVNDYLIERCRVDRDLRNAQDRLEQAGRLVPSVMQLGIAELNLSHDIAEADKRQEMLQSAEQTFLSIRGAAGETDEFRLFLGEVSYWLGKPAEGRKLFDELLTAKHRSSDWLSQVARRLREVGETDQARALVEEGWSAETDSDKKQALAADRQVMSMNAEDRLKWLQRCDTTQASIKADLHSNAGDLAYQEGRLEEAANEYRLSAAEYTRQPENASRLNNEALVWERLARLTGSAADYRKVVTNIERAARLEQSSVLFGNLGTSYLMLANWEANEKVLDLAYLPELADSAQGPGLARTPEEFRAATAAITGSPHLAAARKELAQALVMSPKSPYLYYAQMACFQLESENHAEIQSLLEKVRAAAIDHTAARERAKPKYAGEITATERQSLVKNLERQQAALKTLPATVKPATRTLLESYVLGLENSLRKRSTDEPPVPVAPLLARARALHQAAACNATNYLLVTLLCDAALEDLRRDAAATAIYQLNRWQLDSPDLITLLLLTDATSAAVAAHPLVREALQLLDDRSRLDGDEVSLQRWLWTSRIRPAEADRLKDLIKASAFKQAINELQYELAPYSPDNILYRQLLEMVRDRPEEGRRIVAAAAATGIRILPD